MLIAGLIFVSLCFGFVVLFGAPYLPTLRKQTDTALDLLNLKPGQTLLELGSGDGRVALAAAKRGIHVVGYELNPLLVVVSRLRLLRYRRSTRIIWGNYWQKSWPKTEGVFVFLLDKYMAKLDKKIVHEYGKNVKLVSFAFKIPGKKAVQQRAGLFLYKY